MYRAIAYVSETTKPLDNEALKKLEEDCIKANKRLNITGYLYYEPPFFFQYIEGEFSSISTLMANIRNDHRHSVIKQINIPCINPKFKHWAMKFLNTKPSPKTINTLEQEINQLIIKVDYHTNASAFIKVWNLIDQLALQQNKTNPY